MCFSLAIKTLHVKVLHKSRHRQLPWFQQVLHCYTGRYLITFSIFQLVLYVKKKTFPAEVETHYLFPMENVTDNRQFSKTYINKVSWGYKIALSNRKKKNHQQNCCAWTLLSLAWWLLMHDRIKTLCFKPPIPFSKFRQHAFIFWTFLSTLNAVNSSGLAISIWQPLNFALLKNCLVMCQRSRVRSRQRWQDNLRGFFRWSSCNNTRMAQGDARIHYSFPVLTYFR